MLIRPKQSDRSSFQVIKQNKLELAFGVAVGAAILLGAKYLAAAFLVFWTLAGGQ